MNTKHTHELEPGQRCEICGCHRQHDKNCASLTKHFSANLRFAEEGESASESNVESFTHSNIACIAFHGAGEASDEMLRAWALKAMLALSGIADPAEFMRTVREALQDIAHCDENEGEPDQWQAACDKCHVLLAKMGGVK